MTPLARLELREERPGEVSADGGPAAAAGLLVAGVRRGTARPLVRPLVRGPQPQPGGVLVTSVLTSCGDTGTQSSTLTSSTLHSPWSTLSVLSFLSSCTGAASCRLRDRSFTLEARCSGTRILHLASGDADLLIAINILYPVYQLKECRFPYFRADVPGPVHVVF